MSEFKAIMDMVTEYYRLQSVAMRLYDKAVDHLTGVSRVSVSRWIRCNVF